MTKAPKWARDALRQKERWYDEEKPKEPIMATVLGVLGFFALFGALIMAGNEQSGSGMLFLLGVVFMLVGAIWANRNRPARD